MLGAAANWFLAQCNFVEDSEPPSSNVEQAAPQQEAFQLAYSAAYESIKLPLATIIRASSRA